MKLEMHGHANLLVYGQGAGILFDPLFYGEHHEGVYDVYPPRSFDLDKIGRFDAVVISHAHADHFDPSSVALLPRKVPIITAGDPDITSSLRGLGFHQVIRAESFAPIRVGGVEVIPTPAAAGALEHGFVLRDQETTVWNMIDTFPSAAAIEQVLDAYGPIDLLVAPWQPLHDAAVSTGGGPAFPHGMYSRILTTIARINPRVLVPGACGFWAVGPAAWTNKLLFPLTRERFQRDLAKLDPKLAERVSILEPGESLTLTPRGIAHEQGLIACVTRTGDYDWRDRAFRPLDVLGPPVTEHRGEAASLAECGEAVRGLFEAALPEFVAEHERAFEWHRRWCPVYQYEVVFHEGARQYWTLRFGPEGLAVQVGEDPLRTAFVVLTAGLLIGLIAGTVSWGYAEMSGELRRFDFSYHVDERGLHVPHTVGLTDPLTVMLGSSAEQEYFRANVIEALDERYREAVRAAGWDPDEILHTNQGSPGVPQLAPIDPTAIAQSVMQQIKLVSLNSKQAVPYGAPKEPSEHEEHNAS